MGETRDDRGTEEFDDSQLLGRHSMKQTCASRQGRNKKAPGSKNAPVGAPEPGPVVTTMPVHHPVHTSGNGHRGDAIYYRASGVGFQAALQPRRSVSLGFQSVNGVAGACFSAENRPARCLNRPPRTANHFVRLLPWPHKSCRRSPIRWSARGVSGLGRVKEDALGREAQEREHERQAPVAWSAGYTAGFGRGLWPRSSSRRAVARSWGTSSQSGAVGRVCSDLAHPLWPGWQQWR